MSVLDTIVAILFIIWSLVCCYCFAKGLWLLVKEEDERRDDEKRD